MSPPESAPGAPTLAATAAARGIAHPDRIGRYQVISVLGEGGMGVVYLAEQSAPVRRTVALKLIKLGLDTRQIVSRFDAERQSLAMMDHPNVARVFDAGADDLGRPFFVMEYVPGSAITRHCDEHQLDTRQRLELFCQACAAVQHAHQKGIIHRDLKPSNLLVHEVDGQPVVKVIDFGLAKAMSNGVSERSLATEHGQLLGTPEYMSPEQADGGAAEVDTRTDVYSLGVILYELLTGVLPFDSESLRRGTFADIQRAIRQADAIPPSTRLIRDSDSAIRAATARGTERQTLLRQLRSDLDWVVMKAMDKDPDRRYAAASELAADVQRYLRYEPVLAGPPTVSYRLKKFMRRNRFAVAAGTAVGLAVVLGAAGMTWQAIRATRAERDARAAQAVAEDRRIAAEQNAATVTAVNDFLARMLASVNPAQAQGREITVREVLDTAAERIKEDLADQPAVEAQLRFTIARTYESLGQPDEAMQHFKQALELATAQLGEDSPLALQSLGQISLILTTRGRFAEAEPLVRRSVELFTRSLGPDDPRTLDAMNSLAVCLHSQDRFAEAEPVYRRVIAGMTRELGAEHEDVLVIESNLAFLVAQLGRREEAAQMHRTSLAAQRRVLGVDHPRTMVTQNNLALILQSIREYDEAVELYRDGLERQTRINGPDHPTTYLAMANLGNTLRLRARDADTTAGLDEAESLLRAAWEGQSRIHSAVSPYALESGHNLSLALFALGRVDEALRLTQQALQDAAEQVPAASPLGVRVRSRHAAMLNRAGRFSDAEPLAREALTLAEEVYKPGAGALRDARTALGDALEGLGRSDEAAELRAADAPEPAAPTTAPIS